MNQCAELKESETSRRRTICRRTKMIVRERWRKTSRRPSLTERLLFFVPVGALLRILNNGCTFQRTEHVHSYALVCMSSRGVHLPCLLLYARDRMSRGGGGGLRRLRTSSRKTAKDKNLSHIHTLYLWRNQAAGEAEEDEEAEEVAVSTLYQALALALSASTQLMEFLGDVFQAPTRWLPGFQFQAPAQSK